MMREKVIEALQRVEDPEVRQDIWSLGLIVYLNVTKDGECSVILTPTAYQCPIAIPLAIKVFGELATVPGLKDIDLKVVNYENADDLNEMLQQLRENFKEKSAQ